MVTRTGKEQIERTATDVIHTAEETITGKGKNNYTRWVQIGYTSTAKGLFNPIMGA